MMWQWLRRFIRFLLDFFGGKDYNVRQAGVQPQPTPQTTIVPEYRKSTSIMTFQERKFFRTVLLKEFGGQYVIFSKVRLGDLIWIANEPTDKKYHSNQIQCKHIDFVLCNKGTLEPLLAVELDDSSHDKYDRRESDELKDRICIQAKLPLLRVKVEQNYESDHIFDKVMNLIREQTTSENQAPN